MIASGETPSGAECREVAAYAGRESEDLEHRDERERRRQRERDGIEQRERQGARRDDRAGRAEEIKEEILVARAGRTEPKVPKTQEPKKKKLAPAGTAKVEMLTAKGVPSPPTGLTAASTLFSG
jgi:hypothetical protein